MEGGKKHQKSYFDVLGICCPSEVPLIERILNSKDGIVSVSVIVTTRTVIVVHDADLISQLQIGNLSQKKNTLVISLATIPGEYLILIPNEFNRAL